MADEVVAPVPGTPEYEVAMAAKVDESAAKALEAAAPSPLVDDPAAKEGTAEEAEKALEDASKDESKEDDKSPEDAAKDAAEAAGVDYSSLQAEYDEKGSLSDESYAKLEKVGFPKDVVDAFIEGQSARAEVRLIKGQAAAGGEEQFEQIKSWASTALKPAELEAYNKSITGTEEEMLQAVRGLRSRFEQEYGRAPSLMGGSNSQGLSGYASRAEMVADMKDPRYAKDIAFRSKVETKIARTTAF